MKVFHVGQHNSPGGGLGLVGSWARHVGAPGGGDIRAYLGSPQSRKVTFGNSC